jgi:hypothetical protein
MTEESEKKGFSGLSSLASEVGEEVLPKRPTLPPAKAEPESSSRTTSGADRGQVSTLKPQTPPKGSPAVKWFLAIVGIGILVLLFNAGQDDRSSSSSRGLYSPSSSPSTYTPPRTTVLIFDKPPVGTDNVLSVAQIRWCLREKIRIDTKRPLANTNWEVDAFNQLVAEYNSRCGSFRYQSGTLEQARIEVEGMRVQIVAEALGRSAGPSAPSVPVSPPTSGSSSQTSPPRRAQ